MTAAQNPSPHSDQPEQPDLFAGVTGFEAYSATPPPEAPRADEPLPPPPEEPPAYDTIPTRFLPCGTTRRHIRRGRVRRGAPMIL